MKLLPVLPMKLEQILGAVMLAPVVAGCTSTPLLRPMPPTQTCFQELNGASPVEVRFYLLVFASQSTPNLPWHTHTWASVVRVTKRDSNQSFQVETHTISWMPASLRIRPWDLFVESGVNLDLRRTIEEMRAQGNRVSLWGPYEIKPDLYHHFLAQQAFLESGRVGYQALDTLGEAGLVGNGTNCVHAVVDCDARCGCPVWSVGDASGEFIAKHLDEHGAVINPENSHDWLIPALGLTEYSITRRGLR
jgi:hypothetical protein